MKVQIQKSIKLTDIPDDMLETVNSALQTIHECTAQMLNTRAALCDKEYTFALANLQYALNKAKEVVEQTQGVQHTLASYVEITNGNFSEPKEPTSK